MTMKKKNKVMIAEKSPPGGGGCSFRCLRTKRQSLGSPEALIRGCFHRRCWSLSCSCSCSCCCSRIYLWLCYFRLSFVLGFSLQIKVPFPSLIFPVFPFLLLFPLLPVFFGPFLSGSFFSLLLFFFFFFLISPLFPSSSRISSPPFSAALPLALFLIFSFFPFFLSPPYPFFFFSIFLFSFMPFLSSPFGT